MLERVGVVSRILNENSCFWNVRLFGGRLYSGFTGVVDVKYRARKHVSLIYRCRAKNVANERCCCDIYCVQHFLHHCATFLGTSVVQKMLLATFILHRCSVVCFSLQTIKFGNENGIWCSCFLPTSGIMKFARGTSRYSFAEQQKRFKQDCQRIFDLQNKCGFFGLAYFFLLSSVKEGVR